MSTSKLQRAVSYALSTNFGGYTIRENIRPSWLLSESGTRLELDFYIEELNAAVEVQGEQHYRYVEMFHGSLSGFNDQMKRDEVKRSTCQRAGVRLFEVSSEDEIIDAIVGIISLIPLNTPSEKWTSFPPKEKGRTVQNPPGTKKKKGSDRQHQHAITIKNLQRELSKSNPREDRIEKLRAALKHTFKEEI